MRFVAKTDRLKSVARANLLLDLSRAENSAEHSRRLALYALVLAEHAPNPVDATQLIRLLLLHDLVEIDAGDTPIPAQGDRVAVAGASWRSPRGCSACCRGRRRAPRATLDQVETRVDQPIAAGAPALWDWIAPRIRTWFAAHATSVTE